MSVIKQKLTELRNLIGAVTIYSGVLDPIFEKHSLELPIDIINVILNAEKIKHEYDWAFLGYEALSEKEIFSHYTSPSDRLSFFGAYDYKENFTLSDNMHIYLEDTLQIELEDSEAIKEIGQLLPLFQFQGDYIVVDLRKETYGALIKIFYGHGASFLAPSIKEHVEDLIDGFNEGKYIIYDDDLIYPSAWHLRQKVRSGKLVMDKYGEIVE